ncbi:hypothetical protein HK102_003117 [Quaeritorhiza haematococci]|nr:hypothetical protein HK102_003117 [Quaeritorhiza haematococci]
MARMVRFTGSGNKNAPPKTTSSQSLQIGSPPTPPSISTSVRKAGGSSLGSLASVFSRSSKKSSTRDESTLSTSTTSTTSNTSTEDLTLPSSALPDPKIDHQHQSSVVSTTSTSSSSSIPQNAPLSPSSSPLSSPRLAPTSPSLKPVSHGARGVIRSGARDGAGGQGGIHGHTGGTGVAHTKVFGRGYDRTNAAEDGGQPFLPASYFESNIDEGSAESAGSDSSSGIHGQASHVNEDVIYAKVLIETENPDGSLSSFTLGDILSFYSKSSIRTVINQIKVWGNVHGEYQLWSVHHNTFLSENLPLDAYAFETDPIFEIRKKKRPSIVDAHYAATQVLQSYGFSHGASSPPPDSTSPISTPKVPRLNTTPTSPHSPSYPSSPIASPKPSLDLDPFFHNNDGHHAHRSSDDYRRRSFGSSPPASPVLNQGFFPPGTSYGSPSGRGRISIDVLSERGSMRSRSSIGDTWERRSDNSWSEKSESVDGGSVVASSVSWSSRKHPTVTSFKAGQIYLSLLIFNERKEVVVNSKGLLPSVPITASMSSSAASSSFYPSSAHYDLLEDFTRDSDDFLWARQIAQDWEPSISDLHDPSNPNAFLDANLHERLRDIVYVSGQSHSNWVVRYRKGFYEAAMYLRNLLRLRSLGTIYNAPVHMRNVVTATAGGGSGGFDSAASGTAACIVALIYAGKRKYGPVDASGNLYPDATLETDVLKKAKLSWARSRAMDPKIYLQVGDEHSNLWASYWKVYQRAMAVLKSGLYLGLFYAMNSTRGISEYFQSCFAVLLSNV